MSEREPQVGDWYFCCCEADLYQISGEAELAEVRAYLADDDPATVGIRPKVFPTYEEARRAALGDA